MEFLKMNLPTGGVLSAWLHEDSEDMPHDFCRRRPALIICPGGGYFMTSDREADPVASAFFNMGLQVFILRYTVQELASDKRPLEQLARSVKLVRENALQWHLDPDKVLVMGFSAGGHLACSIGVHWHDPEILQRCGAGERQLRPDGLILCYPVITMGKYTHEGTRELVTANTKEPMEYWSLETQVKPSTPPTFLWHTMEDDCVPIENTLYFATALHNAGVSCECHIFADGGHGMSVCTGEVGTPSDANRAWVGLCRAWIASKFGPIPGL